MESSAKVWQTYRQIRSLTHAISLLNWDRQVLMPSGGAAARTRHVLNLVAKNHALLVSDEFRRDIESARAALDPDTEEGHQLRVLAEDVARESRIPADLVARKARVGSDAYEVWKVAKATNDFKKLAPYYTELFEIARETSAAIGPAEHPYDNLIDLYESGATYRDAAQMFERLKPASIALLQAIRESGTQVDASPLNGDWPPEQLRSAVQPMAAQIGFDFNRGRLDVAPNAFCSGLTNADVRMTTRPSVHIKGILSSSLHEMGHGLYDQGTPPEWNDTPLGGGVSLGVHESQSRLWENIVGRSRPFWRYFFPHLARAVPEIAGLGAEGFYRAYNAIEPEFIRVGSDEISYNLHILVRFELEVEIITGQLAVKDLPEAWNAKYTEYLGITPPTDTLGCLQDVHWSRGSIGYFPTYAMGNLIGGAMWSRLRADIPEVDTQMESGDFSGVLGWLTERVYRQGRRIPARTLVEKVCGTYLNPDPWLTYARSKYGDIYGITLP